MWQKYPRRALRRSKSDRSRSAIISQRLFCNIITRNTKRRSPSIGLPRGNWAMNRVLKTTIYFDFISLKDGVRREVLPNPLLLGRFLKACRSAWMRATCLLWRECLHFSICQDPLPWVHNHHTWCRHNLRAISDLRIKFLLLLLPLTLRLFYLRDGHTTRR